MPTCRECFGIGEWTDYRGNAGGITVICGCPAGQRRQTFLEHHWPNGSARR